MSDLSKFEKNLEVLKDMLITADDFKDVYEYFFDHMAENPDFIKLGKRSENPSLKRVTELIAKRLFKKKVKVRNLLLKKIPEYSFYHGPCLIKGRMAGVLFFEDIDVGMLSVLFRPDTCETRFIRFSSVQTENSKMKNSGNVIFCAPKNKTIH
ncbi:MAG: hypothetical protein B6245_16200 [Desulfobacteraceae bacterium 4572_88]|nr:MAG: hypothetical protein B6245_16200 [Desulfobacteraceae bacterium 4572_88]